MESEKSDASPPLAEPLANVEAGSSQLPPWQCFRSGQWWKNMARMSLFFARQCLVPASLWFSAICTIMLPGLIITQFAGSSVAGLMQIIIFLVIYLLTLLVSLPLFVWCFAAWLVRLTAYAAALTRFSSAELTSRALEKAEIISAQLEALERTRLNKKFLAKYWSTLTLFLLIPFFIFVVSMLLLTCTSTAMLGPSALVMPSWAMTTATICLFVSGLYATTVSFAGICLSSSQGSNPVDLAKRTIALSFKNLIPLVTITAVSGVFNTLVTSPIEVIQFGQPPRHLTGLGSFTLAAEELWRAGTSTIAWTLTLAPICEYIRGKTDNGH